MEEKMHVKERNGENVCENKRRIEWIKRGAKDDRIKEGNNWEKKRTP